MVIIRREDSATLGARGSKARLEYKKPPPEKPEISGFSGNSILPEAKCSAAEAQSKKSAMDFFDKLRLLFRLRRKGSV